MAVPTNISLVDLEAHSRRMLVVEAEVTGTLIVSTGLEEVEHVFPVLEEDAGLTGLVATCEIANQTTYPGRITLKVWKPTATGDCTMIAATAAKTVRCLVIGEGVQSH
jgi:hypothetical protein